MLHAILNLSNMQKFAALIVKRIGFCFHYSISMIRSFLENIDPFHYKYNTIK